MPLRCPGERGCSLHQATYRCDMRVISLARHLRSLAPRGAEFGWPSGLHPTGRKGQLFTSRAAASTGPDLLTFTLIIDDIVLPDGVTAMGMLGGGGPQVIVSRPPCAGTARFRWPVRRRDASTCTSPSPAVRVSSGRGR